jgi:hypothetical protein
VSDQENKEDGGDEGGWESLADFESETGASAPERKEEHVDSGGWEDYAEPDAPASRAPASARGPERKERARDDAPALAIHISANLLSSDSSSLGSGKGNAVAAGFIYLNHPGGYSGDVWHLVAALVLDSRVRVIMTIGSDAKELEVSPGLLDYYESLGLRHRIIVYRETGNISGKRQPWYVDETPVGKADASQHRSFAEHSLNKDAKQARGRVHWVYSSTSVIMRAVERLGRAEAIKRLQEALRGRLSEEQSGIIATEARKVLATCGVGRGKKVLFINVRDAKYNSEHDLDAGRLRLILQGAKARNATVYLLGRKPEWLKSYIKQQPEAFAGHFDVFDIKKLLKTPACEQQITACFWAVMAQEGGADIGFVGGRSGSTDIAAFMGFRVLCWDIFDCANPEYLRLRITAPVLLQLTHIPSGSKKPLRVLPLKASTLDSDVSTFLGGGVVMPRLAISYTAPPVAKGGKKLSAKDQKSAAKAEGENTKAATLAVEELHSVFRLITIASPCTQPLDYGAPDLKEIIKAVAAEGRIVEAPWCAYASTGAPAAVPERRVEEIPANGDCMYAAVSQGYRHLRRGNRSVGALRGLVADGLAGEEGAARIKLVLTERRQSLLESADFRGRPREALDASDMQGALKDAIGRSLVAPDVVYAWEQRDVEAYIAAVRTTTLHAGDLEGAILGRALNVRIEYDTNGEGPGVLATGPLAAPAEDDVEEEVGDRKVEAVVHEERKGDEGPDVICLRYNGTDHYDLYVSEDAGGAEEEAEEVES